MADIPNGVKAYLMFAGVSVTINVMFLELVIAPMIAPEHQKVIAEHGWMYFFFNMILGAMVLFLIISLVGTIVFLKTGFRPRIMGILSWALGFLLEFTLMKPEWVQSLLNLTPTEDAIGAIIVSSIYWLIPWGLPSYLLYRFSLVTKE